MTEKKEIEFEIKNLEFLTPAKITVSIDGKEETLLISVDFVNKKAFLQDGNLISYNDKIFQYLENVNTLPEDFFAPPEDVQESARNAQMQSDLIIQQALSGELQNE